MGDNHTQLLPNYVVGQVSLWSVKLLGSAFRLFSHISYYFHYNGIYHRDTSISIKNLSFSPKSKLFPKIQIIQVN